MNHVLRSLFFLLVVRPTVLFLLGLNVRHRERLPGSGPAMLAANHNSHLDALVLMTLFPKRMLPRLRPVAAQDYFFRYRLLKWFALHIIGIIPLDRRLRKTGRHPLAPISDALQHDDIIILFPEGTRGDPEQLSEFKTGIAHLAEQHADVPIYPIYMHGLGKALPRGEALLIPFFCDVFIGESIQWTGDRESFLTALNQRVKSLVEEGHFADWQ